ncbi:MAG: hypothetical protein HGA85_06500 [Nanoarchaeota archaeon]|nr:hypothetical protein [Nanoarchaeota archaeon]
MQVSKNKLDQSELELLRRKLELAELKHTRQELEIAELKLLLKESESKQAGLEASSEKQKSLESKLEEKESILLRQKQIIGNFRGSVVYPLYAFTSAFGRSSLGQAVRKILHR